MYADTTYRFVGSWSAALGSALRSSKRSSMFEVAMRSAFAAPPLSRHHVDIAVFHTRRPRICTPNPSSWSALSMSSSLGTTQRGEPAEPVSHQSSFSSIERIPATSTVLPDWYIHVDWPAQSRSGMSTGWFRSRSISGP